MEQGTLPGTVTTSQARDGMLSDLNSWATLQGLLPKLDNEADVRFLMTAEQSGKNRIRIIDRLYARYSVLRRERERRDLASGTLPF